MFDLLFILNFPILCSPKIGINQNSCITIEVETTTKQNCKSNMSNFIYYIFKCFIKSASRKNLNTLSFNVEDIWYILEKKHD